MTQPPHIPQEGVGKSGVLIPSFPVKLGFLAEPIVSLNQHVSPTLYGEALARLILPPSTIVRAGCFVPQLEANGAIGLLDFAMLQLVLQALEQDPKALLSCNISPFPWRTRSAGGDYCGLSTIAGKLQDD